MIAIAINHTTQQWIADEFNEGVVPLLGYQDVEFSNGEDTYYLVKDEDTPNEIVTNEEFWTKWFDQVEKVITIHKK